jgi:hypothetical protein
VALIAPRSQVSHVDFANSTNPGAPTETAIFESMAVFTFILVATTPRSTGWLASGLFYRHILLTRITCEIGGSYGLRKKKYIMTRAAR